MIRVIKTNFSATKETINLLFVAKGTEPQGKTLRSLFWSDVR